MGGADGYCVWFANNGLSDGSNEGDALGATTLAYPYPPVSPATPSTSPRAAASAPAYIAKQEMGAAPKVSGDLTVASSWKVAPPSVDLTTTPLDEAT